MRPIATSPGTRSVLILAAAAVLAATLVTAPVVAPSPAFVIPTASASCPDVEVVFARGRQEPPGVGQIGDAFVNALRSQTSRSVGVYGVNYPADLSAASGADDMRAHVTSMASSCPNTRLVLGGYSLGATAADLMARGGVPSSANPSIAAIALFGNAGKRLGPAPAFSGRTIDQCAAGDPVCGRGIDWPSHLQPSYLSSGLVEQAAGFAAGKL